jgi:hypothetical protein
MQWLLLLCTHFVGLVCVSWCVDFFPLCCVQLFSSNRKLCRNPMNTLKIKSRGLMARHCKQRAAHNIDSETVMKESVGVKPTCFSSAMTLGLLDDITCDVEFENSNFCVILN